LKEKGDMQTGS